MIEMKKMMTMKGMSSVGRMIPMKGVFSMERMIPCVGMALCLSLSLTTTSCGQKKQEQEATQAQASFKTMTVSRSDKALSTSYSASIKGKQDIDIYPQVAGKIQRLCVREGDKVSRGQLLFVIDQVPYRAALATALAAEKSAQAQLSSALLTYNSNKELFAQKVVSSYTLQTSQNAYLTAKAQLAQAKAQVTDARNNLSYTEVRSPANGVVGVLPYRVGTLVSASMPKPLTTVSDNSQMYIYFSMTEKQLLSFVRQYGSKDAAIQNMPEVSLQLGDQSMYEHKGKVESISGVIDTETGAVTLRAEFPNPERLLNSGGSGNVIIPSVRKNCIVIPQSATVQQQDQRIVYKVLNGKAVSQLIKVENIDDGRSFIVTDGLKPGDVIVSEGAGMIHEGEEVKVKK